MTKGTVLSDNITIDDDFDLDKMIDSGQCFRPRRLEEGVYRFVTGEHTVDITDETLLKRVRRTPIRSRGFPCRVQRKSGTEYGIRISILIRITGR